MYCTLDELEFMPVWLPPTPPPSDSDTAFVDDPVLAFWYEQEFMSESQLPPVHQESVPPPPPKPRRDLKDGGHASKATKAATARDRKMSASKLASLLTADSSAERRVARSLFDAPPPLSRHKAGAEQMRRAWTPPPPVLERDNYEGPEWSVLEDMAMLNAVTKEQQMASNLLTKNGGHAINWHFVAESVNRLSLRYRSPRQCAFRYQLVVLPREEGRLVAVDPLTKKSRRVPMSNQEIAHMKKGLLQTAQQFEQDGRLLLRQRLVERIKAVLSSVKSRVQLPKHKRVMPYGGRLGSAQEAALSHFNVGYECAMSPANVAELRVDRALRAEQQQEAARRLKEKQMMELAAKQAAQAAAAQEAHHAAATTSSALEPAHTAAHSIASQRAASRHDSAPSSDGVVSTMGAQPSIPLAPGTFFFTQGRATADGATAPTTAAAYATARSTVASLRPIAPHGKARAGVTRSLIHPAGDHGDPSAPSADMARHRQAGRLPSSGVQVKNTCAQHMQIGLSTRYFVTTTPHQQPSSSSAPRYSSAGYTTAAQRKVGAGGYARPPTSSRAINVGQPSMRSAVPQIVGQQRASLQTRQLPVMSTQAASSLRIPPINVFIPVARQEVIPSHADVAPPTSLGVLLATVPATEPPVSAAATPTHTSLSSK